MIRLYPEVKVQGKSFLHEKKLVIPNQSMSLREIIRRFVRKESLPVLAEGFYEERFGDLEKLKNEDITVQKERIAELKQQIKKFTEKMEAQQKQKEASSQSTTTTNSGVGETPVKVPPLQGS